MSFSPRATEDRATTGGRLLLTGSSGWQVDHQTSFVLETPGAEAARGIPASAAPLAFDREIDACWLASINRSIILPPSRPSTARTSHPSRPGDGARAVLQEEDHKVKSMRATIDELVLLSPRTMKRAHATLGDWSSYAGAPSANTITAALVNTLNAATLSAAAAAAAAKQKQPKEPSTRILDLSKPTPPPSPRKAKPPPPPPLLEERGHSRAMIAATRTDPMLEGLQPKHFFRTEAAKAKEAEEEEEEAKVAALAAANEMPRGEAEVRSLCKALGSAAGDALKRSTTTSQEPDGGDGSKSSSRRQPVNFVEESMRQATCVSLLMSLRASLAELITTSAMKWPGEVRCGEAARAC